MALSDHIEKFELCDSSRSQVPNSDGSKIAAERRHSKEGHGTTKSAKIQHRQRPEDARWGAGCPRMRVSFHSTPFFVNLLARFFRPFFSVEKRSSQEQLRLDFGEFPPTPLRCESLTGEFNVVRTSGIGQIYHDLAVQMRVLDADIESLSTDLVANFGADRLHDLQSTLEKLGPQGSRFAKRAMFGWLFVVRTVRAIRYGTKRPNVLGLFVPFFKDELQIFVKARGHLNKSDAPIVYAFIKQHEQEHMLGSLCWLHHSPFIRFKMGWPDAYLLAPIQN